MTKQTNLQQAEPALWPYCERSGLIDRELAARIREWALTEMTETELHSYSQRQLKQMYIQRHLGPTVERVLKRQRTPQEAEVAAKDALDRGELYGIPLDPPRVILDKAFPQEEDRRAAIEYIAG